MEKGVKKYIRENVNRIWKDNEDKTFHYPKVKEEYLAVAKKELQRFAEIMVEDVEKLFSQELDKAREEGRREVYEAIVFDENIPHDITTFVAANLWKNMRDKAKEELSKLKDNK